MELKSIEIIWGAEKNYYKLGVKDCSKITWDKATNVVEVKLASTTLYLNLNNTISYNVDPL